MGGGDTVRCVRVRFCFLRTRFWDKTDKADKQNGKVTTFKHWKFKTKARIIKHCFETKRTKQNGQSGQNEQNGKADKTDKADKTKKKLTKQTNKMGK